MSVCVAMDRHMGVVGRGNGGLRSTSAFSLQSSTLSLETESHPGIHQAGWAASQQVPGFYLSPLHGDRNGATVLRFQLWAKGLTSGPCVSMAGAEDAKPSPRPAYLV